MQECAVEELVTDIQPNMPGSKTNGSMCMVHDVSN